VAQRALAANDGRGALRALERYRARFAHGELAAEEALLRVEALMATGDVKGATALAAELSERYRDTPYGKRIEALVRPK